MLSMVGIDHTDFINPNLTWGTGSKGNRSNSRRSRRSMSFGSKMGSELLEKSQKNRVEEPSVSESEKLGVAVLGHRFGDKVENVPIKKRRFLLRSPSPPPRINIDSSCTLAQLDLSSVAKSSSGKDGSAIDEAGGSGRMIYIHEKAMYNEDFSGIEMLAAAACSDHILEEDECSLLQKIAVPGERVELPVMPAISHDRSQWDLNTDIDEWQKPTEKDDIDGTETEHKSGESNGECEEREDKGQEDAFDEGYDSQFEDGELREESLAHCWEDSEADNGEDEHSDYESDNGDVSNDLGTIDHATANTSKSAVSVKGEILNLTNILKVEEGTTKVKPSSSNNIELNKSRARFSGLDCRQRVGRTTLRKSRSNDRIYDEDQGMFHSSTRHPPLKRLDEINNFERRRFSTYEYRRQRPRSMGMHSPANYIDSDNPERPIFHFRGRTFVRSPDLDVDYQPARSRDRNGRYLRTRDDGYYRSPPGDSAQPLDHTPRSLNRSFSPRFHRQTRSRSYSPREGIAGFRPPPGRGRGRFSLQKPRFELDYEDDFASSLPRRNPRWVNEKHYRFAEAREQQFRPGPRFTLARRVKQDRYFEKKSSRFVDIAGRWQRYDGEEDVQRTPRNRLSSTRGQYRPRHLSYDDGFEP